MTCPVCGGIPAGAQVWVHCPRVQDAICMAHCYEGCKYHDTTASVGPVSYTHLDVYKRQQLTTGYFFITKRSE